MNTNYTNKYLLFFLIALVFTNTSNADVVSVSLPISEVTVHPETAIVVRQGSITLPQGEHTLTITGLPKNLDPARIRLSSEGSKLILGSIDIQSIHQGETNDALERRLEEELYSFLDQQKMLEDQKATAQSMLTLVQSMTSGGDKGQIRPNIDPSSLTNLFQQLSEHDSSARQAIREAEKSLRELDSFLEQKQHEKNKNREKAAVETRVSVNVRAEADYQGLIALSYPEENAQWEWLYEARLDTKTKELLLFRQVQVSQQTGDSWENVNLTVTTAAATENAQTPELFSSTVDIFEIDEEDKFTPYRPRYTASAPTSVASADLIEEIVVTGSYIKHDEAEVIASQYLVEYAIPGKVSIPSSNQSKILPIDQKSFSVDLVARTVPSLDTNAYLEASFDYLGKIPIQTGELQLYRDNAYVGEGYLPAILPTKNIRVPFGKDDLIKVEIRQQSESDNENRSFGRKNLEDIHFNIQVSNFHQDPIFVEVLERVPVARNEKIDIEYHKDATPFDEFDIDGLKGVNLWKIKTLPAEMSLIQYRLKITYPRNTELEFDEDY